MRPPDIDPADLKRRLDAGETPCILDVREPWEVSIAKLPASVNIPLSEIPLRLQELDAGSEIVVLCHAGGRSRRAADYLAAQGFGKVANLRGGIDAWSEEVDAAVPRY